MSNFILNEQPGRTALINGKEYLLKLQQQEAEKMLQIKIVPTLLRELFRLLLVIVILAVIIILILLVIVLNYICNVLD